MTTIAELDRQLRQWLHPLRLWLVHGEVKQLPQLLQEDERIESAAQGWYEGGLVLLLATNRRLLVVDHKILDTKVDDFPYSRVNAIEHESSVWMGKIIISMPGRDLEVHKINTKNLSHFCDTVLNRITKEDTPPEPAALQLGNLQVLALLVDKDILANPELQQQWQGLLKPHGNEYLDYKLPQTS